MAAGQNNLARKLTVIPASQRPKDLTLRVAAYCRVSSSSEDQLNSFAAQNAYYTSLISGKENWTLVDIYSDEGTTGTSAEKREDFQRLMNDCRKGLIDKVLTKSISRFARNTKDCLNATRELKALGIGVVFEEQHIDTSIVTGEMLTAVFASCAQTESESISKNVWWGIQKRMQNGTFLPPHQPFGYEIIDGQICIQTVQAQYVREIFRMYLSGISAYRIADYLNKQQSTCPELQNYTWTYNAITRILRNEKYTGNSLWQKTYRTETLPRKKYPNRGNVDQYSVSDKETLADHLTAAMSCEIITFPNTQQSLGDIERGLEALETEFMALFDVLEESNPAPDYMDRFHAITEEQAELKRKKAALEDQQKAHSMGCDRVRVAQELLEDMSPSLEQWDEITIRQLVHAVKVVSAECIEVHLTCGKVIRQNVENSVRKRRL